MGDIALNSSGYIEFSGVRTAFRSDGNPRGTPVVFSNSLAANLSMWDEQVAALSDRYRVVRYDTRGHGASGAFERDCGIEELANDVIALLDHLGLESAHFVGLSLGGMIGQVLGARHAPRIRSLTLCDTTCEMPPGVWDERIEAARSQGMAGLVETTLARWFLPGFSHARPERLEQVRRMIADTSPNGYAGCAAAIRDMALCSLLGDIQAPTLVIVGAEDASTPVSMAERLHHGITGSKLAVIPNAAHLPNIEQPQAFNKALSTFLNEVEDALVKG